MSGLNDTIFYLYDRFGQFHAIPERDILQIQDPVLLGPKSEFHLIHGRAEKNLQNSIYPAKLTLTFSDPRRKWVWRSFCIPQRRISSYYLDAHMRHDYRF